MNRLFVRDLSLIHIWQRLLTLLASGGADTIKTAAQAALRGDEATARAAMMSLLGTREGAMLAKRMADAMNNGKR